MSTDDLNWLIGELRGAHAPAILAQCVDTYKGLNREYAQIARPYMRAHAPAILALDDRHSRSTVDCIDTLPITDLHVDGERAAVAATAREIYDMIRKAYRARHCVELTLDLVVNAPVSLHLGHAAPYATCEAVGLSYQGRWYYDEARSHAAAIEEAAAEAAERVSEGASVWSVWRAALRAAAADHVDLYQWIHEIYEQASYTQAVNAAEWGVICEVAGALHPDRSYLEYRDATQGSAAWVEIQALTRALHGADIYTETEEICGDVYAYLPNSPRLRRVLDDFAREWHGPGADPEEIHDAIERALAWAH